VANIAKVVEIASYEDRRSSGTTSVVYS